MALAIHVLHGSYLILLNISCCVSIIIRKSFVV